MARDWQRLTAVSRPLFFSLALLLLVACSKGAPETATHAGNSAPRTETSVAAAPDTSPAPSSSSQSPPRPELPRIENEPRLLPVDEAASDPSFAAFRVQLQSVVRQRDTKSLLAIVDPKVRVTFGESNGVEAFRRQWKPEDPASPLWSELDSVLSLGGAFQKAPDGIPRYFAPYTYAKWPESSDAFETLAAVCAGAIVYERPDRSSNPVAMLDWNILRIAKEDPLRNAQKPTGWRTVVLPDGRTAWGESRCLRSSVDYRAAFEKRNGKWMLVFFVAGD